MQKTSMTFDINIESRESQVQQNILPNWLSAHCTKVEAELRYSLPRHLFNPADLSLKTKSHDSVGSKKFNDKMIRANA